MENTNNYFGENIGKCPYHSQLKAAEENTESRNQDANTGDWNDERDERTEREGYDNDRNDNSGGAGSTGSASTNS